MEQLMEQRVSRLGFGHCLFGGRRAVGRSTEQHVVVASFGKLSVWRKKSGCMVHGVAPLWPGFERYLFGGRRVVEQLAFHGHGACLARSRGAST